MSDENKKIKYFRECYEAENARRRNVEQKASIYIGTLGVVGTILANGLIRLVQDTNTMPAFITLLCVLFIVAITVCMTCSSYHAIGAVLKKNNYCIDPREIKSNYKDEDLEENLCDDYYKATIANYDITNLKVDSMDSAQFWMRRAVVLLAVFALFLLCYYSIRDYGAICQSAVSGWRFICDINDFLTITALILSLVSLSVSAYAVRYICKQKDDVADLTKRVKEAEHKHSVLMMAISKKEAPASASPVAKSHEEEGEPIDTEELEELPTVTQPIAEAATEEEEESADGDDGTQETMETQEPSADTPTVAEAATPEEETSTEVEEKIRD